MRMAPFTFPAGAAQGRPTSQHAPCPSWDLLQNLENEKWKIETNDTKLTSRYENRNKSNQFKQNIINNLNQKQCHIFFRTGENHLGAGHVLLWVDKVGDKMLAGPDFNYGGEIIWKTIY